MLNPTIQRHGPSHPLPEPCRRQNSQVKFSSQTSSFGQSGITFVATASMRRRARSGRELEGWSATDEIPLNGRITSLGSWVGGWNSSNDISCSSTDTGFDGQGKPRESSQVCGHGSDGYRCLCVPQKFILLDQFPNSSGPVQDSTKR